MTANQPTDANALLMGSGGAPSVKLTEGVTVTGRIVHITEPYQEREFDPNNPGNGALKFFKSGSPIMTFAIDLATDQRDPAIEDDDGTRRLYMDGKRIKDAVRAGIRAAGANGLDVGGTLTVTCTHYDTPGDLRSGKNYAVQYVPGSPANAVLMGQPEQAAPAPQPVQQQFHGQPVGAPPQWAQPAQQPAPAPAAPAPDPATIAALQAAGVDPATVYPGWQG